MCRRVLFLLYCLFFLSRLEFWVGLELYVFTMGFKVVLVLKACGVLVVGVFVFGVLDFRAYGCWEGFERFGSCGVDRGVDGRGWRRFRFFGVGFRRVRR